MAGLTFKHLLSLKRKFIIYASISSPLLALSGARPFYTFGILDADHTIGLFISVLISVILYWLINGYLFLILKKERRWDFFLLSYLLTFLSNVLKAPFQSFMTFTSSLQEYFVYPITAALALNTIILLMINLIIEEGEKKKAKDTIGELTIQKLEAENRVLTQQLQPHFLFNALSILKSLIKEDADLAEEYAIKLSDFLRYSVQSHTTELVSVRDEMEFVNNYIDLQKIRFEEAFMFHAEIPEDLMKTAKVPIFAIQALVENAFKHNYFTEKRPLKIVISYQEDMLEVSNNLVSLKLTERAGTGLNNLEKRYEFISGTSIEIHKSDTHFSVKIPLIIS